ncbi:hypothetical protein LJPFL01_4033 [Lelliottia jeotgali]|nr:hypothetical protein LJPFL01_4033 [Lelliottia jeotgali]NTZ46639.1 hypothetical protein [Lelliottia aquatilis]
MHKIFLLFGLTKGHITHSKSDISICNRGAKRREKQQKADNLQPDENSSMKCFTEFKYQLIKLVFG